MALQYVTTDGTLIIPGAYSKITVQTANSGLSTTGVIAIVGEADGGPDFTLESDLSLNKYGPDQIGAIVAKYKTGPIVDMARALASPANDPDISGAVNRILVVKTNKSGKASGALKKYDASTYGTLFDQSWGKLGNLISYQTTAKATEVVPTTGALTYIPPVKLATANLRANGGAQLALSVTAGMLPSAFQAAVAALSGIAATGGVNRASLTGGSIAGQNLVVTNTGGNGILISASAGAWAVTPTIGDTLIILTTSTFVTGGGGSATNAGSYVVTAASSTTINATKLADDSGTGVPGVITAPTGRISAAANTGDFAAYSPVTISNSTGSSNPIDGTGKTLEIAENSTRTGSAESVANVLYTLATTTVAPVVAKTGASLVLTSATEYAVTLTNSRQTDNLSEAITAGGEVAMLVGYLGTTASITVSVVSGVLQLSSAATGGSGAAFATINLKDYPTIADVVGYIKVQTGWSAAVGNGILGQLPSSALDQGTYGVCTTWGGTAGRVKLDAYRFYQRLSQQSVLVQLGNPTAAASTGLPAPMAAAAIFAGGSRGPTLAADVVAAVDALQMQRLNFVVPLFSRDASVDITDGTTDSASTYTIDAVNAYVKSHVLAMSSYKRRRNRQAFLSKVDTFVNDQTGASNIASYRCSYAFQDCKNVASDGSIAQFQSWMTAGLAAGMQAAGFYKAIFGKGINASGFVQRAADFNDQDDSAVENALLAGLLVVRRQEDGTLQFVADYTTYGKDSNFVYNSIQATYAADLIALTTAQRMEKAFKGKSVADVSATMALAFLEAIMADFLRLKLIAPSTDAPKGFKNAKVTISGPAMIVEIEVKLAGAIYFIPISFLVSQVQQTAG